jgi:hypothetical protein
VKNAPSEGPRTSPNYANARPRRTPNSRGFATRFENGIADLADPMLKDRVAELKTTRDQARADAERAEGAIERLGPTITPQTLKAFARTARKRMRTQSGGYRRDQLRALAQRVEVDAQELRIRGRKANCCARSSPLQAQKRRVLACPVLYVRRKGFEPLTPRFEVWCSIQLSYRRAAKR